MKKTLVVYYMTLPCAHAFGRSEFLQKCLTTMLTAEYSANLYDGWASKYDELDGGVAAKVLGIEDMRKRYVGENARGAVLEVGAGTGLNAPWLRMVSSLTLVDLSEGMLAQAKIKLPDAKYYVADAANLPFPDNYFDTVLETFCLCVVDNPYTVLREMHRVVKKQPNSGKIIILDNSRPKNPLVSTILDLGAATQFGSLANKQCRPDLDLTQILASMNNLFSIQQSDNFGAGFFRAYLLSPK
mmetsp:Transcript_2365/g.3798  ORF Transcript_2365/g.3798 Transcript_2365/m.3798 type:complete len:242 (+) Transcript_2365:64-789(+)